MRGAITIGETGDVPKLASRVGRQVLDRTGGFRRLLAAVEGDRLERLEPTLALFEKDLPYAVALDVEDRWAARCEDVLEAASRPGDPRSAGIPAPRWPPAARARRLVDLVDGRVLVVGAGIELRGAAGRLVRRRRRRGW